MLLLSGLASGIVYGTRGPSGCAGWAQGVGCFITFGRSYPFRGLYQKTLQVRELLVFGAKGI